MRLQNLSAAVIRPQIPEILSRVEAGRRGHDRVAAKLVEHPWFEVPPALPQEERAPDSLQFLLRGFDRDEDAGAFLAAAAKRGVAVQIFGLSPDNARAFWNWQFLGDLPDLPVTRAMLMRTCDLRLPTRLSTTDLDLIAEVLIAAAAEVRRG